MHLATTACEGELKSLAPMLKRHNIDGIRFINITSQQVQAFAADERLSDRLVLLRNSVLSLSTTEEKKGK